MADNGDLRTYTLDELAKAAGMTPRNLRAYRTRGLLPPPQDVRPVRFGTEHLARLRRIHALREAGIPLGVLTAWLQEGIDLDGLPLAGLRQAGDLAEQHRLPLDESLVDAWRRRDPELLEQLSRRGVVTVAGRRVLASPQLRHTLRELTELGVTPTASLRIASRAAEGADAVAEEVRTGVRRPGTSPAAMLDLLVRLSVGALRDALTVRLQAAGHRTARHPRGR